MIQLRKLTLREIRLPLKEPFRISSGVVTERQILLVELESNDGERVWAESVASERPNYTWETIDTAWLALKEWVGPRVLGVPIDGPEQVHGLLEKDFRGHRMAKAAVEMGLWALAAEQDGISLARRLGGERSSIPVGVSLGIQATPEALAQKAAAAVRQGYRKIKLKIRPGSDIDFVAAVRYALP
ncbi:MAG: o-succinylbenzoate synthase, partial [Longimicrobiales bacterium]